MSTDLIVREEHGYKLTQFYGGDKRGKMIQITPLKGGDLPADAFPIHLQMSPEGLHALAADIYRLGDDPTPEEMGAALMEMEEMLATLRTERDKFRDQAREFEEDLRETHQELEESKAMATEMFDEAKRAQKEANETRAELRELNKERIKSRERSEVLGKELDHAREERAKVERDLSRALGYIDRVVEDEPPVKNPIMAVHRQVGEVGESFVSGGGRGPVLGNDPWR